MTTPTRQRYREIIEPWWKGGGTASRILDVLEREEVSEKVAALTASKLSTSANRLSVITEAIIEGQLELAQAATSLGDGSIGREFDTWLCVFEAKAPCPQCSSFGESITHGPLVNR